jgi:hypothetical protein
MKHAIRLIPFVAVLASVTACDDRLDPISGGIRRPPSVVEAGDFQVVAVNDTLLPHTATNSGVNYTLVSGTFQLHADSTWLFSTVESLTGTNGQVIGNSPANYTGTWGVLESTIVLQSHGTATVKGDTIFWRGGPKHTFEDSIKYTMVRK